MTVDLEWSPYTVFYSCRISWVSILGRCLFSSYSADFHTKTAKTEDHPNFLRLRTFPIQSFACSVRLFISSPLPWPLLVPSSWTAKQTAKEGRELLHFLVLIISDFLSQLRKERLTFWRCVKNLSAWTELPFPRPWPFWSIFIRKLLWVTWRPESIFASKIFLRVIRSTLS